MWYFCINRDAGATFVRFPTFFVSPESVKADCGANTVVVRQAPEQGDGGWDAPTFRAGVLHL